MSEKRFSWKTEKLQHSDDEVLLVVDNANKEWKGHILNIVDKLNELSDEIGQLKEENEQLRKSVEYWQKKFEEGTETFISENDDIQPFKFNSNQAQPYTIKNVSPNGVVRLGNGHKAQWRMKDVREISQELPSFEEFNREIFHEIRNKLGAKFDKDVLGRIIYNIYLGTFGEYI